VQSYQSNHGLFPAIVVGRFSEGLRKKRIDLNLRFQDNMQHVLHEPKNTQHKLDEQQLVFFKPWVRQDCKHIFKSHVVHVAVDGKLEFIQIFIDII